MAEKNFQYNGNPVRVIRTNGLANRFITTKISKTTFYNMLYVVLNYLILLVDWYLYSERVGNDILVMFYIHRSCG